MHYNRDAVTTQMDIEFYIWESGCQRKIKSRQGVFGSLGRKTSMSNYCKTHEISRLRIYRYVKYVEKTSTQRTVISKSPLCQDLGGTGFLVGEGSERHSIIDLPRDI